MYHSTDAVLLFDLCCYCSYVRLRLCVTLIVWILEAVFPLCVSFFSFAFHVYFPSPSIAFPIRHVLYYQCLLLSTNHPTIRFLRTVFPLLCSFVVTHTHTVQTLFFFGSAGSSLFFFFFLVLQTLATLSSNCQTLRASVEFYR